LKTNLYLVGVGASAGGHEALQEFFKMIPSDLPAAFVVITHLLRDYKSQLTSIVTRFTKLKVSSITGIVHPRAGRVYVMPEDVIAVMKEGILYLKPRPTDTLINNAIDIFFESLAVEEQSNAIGVILSGMGSDGSKGALKLYEVGGEVLVQDPKTTQFNGMPWAAIINDHPEYVLPPRELGQKDLDLIRMKSQSAPVQRTA
jgi:two-component system, chemotaxis family, protein-glutamate methylesterase/glutaminase